MRFDSSRGYSTILTHNNRKHNRQKNSRLQVRVLPWVSDLNRSKMYEYIPVTLVTPTEAKKYREKSENFRSAEFGNLAYAQIAIAEWLANQDGKTLYYTTMLTGILKKKKIKLNSVRCVRCNTTLVSKHTYDFQRCNCNDENYIFTDGGTEYIRRAGILEQMEPLDVYYE